MNFSKLSINNNKKFNGGILCTDIRGFTKLFNKTDNNLDDLCDVLDETYEIMGDVVQEEEGTKVQYQGDRIVAEFNDFGDEDPYVIRMLRAGLKLNEEIQELNDRYDIKDKLKSKKITIGIGCAIGEHAKIWREKLQNSF